MYMNVTHFHQKGVIVCQYLTIYIEHFSKFSSKRENILAKIIEKYTKNSPHYVLRLF